TSGHPAIGEHGFALGSFAVSDGNDGKNYTVTVPAAATFSVSKLELTHNIVVDTSKVYDGTDTAKYTGSGLTNALSGDNVSLDDFTLNYATVNADAGIAVTPSQWKLTGTDTGCYTLPAFGEQKATITAHPIMLSIQQGSVAYGDLVNPTVSIASGSSLASRDELPSNSGTLLAITGDTSTSGHPAIGEHGFALGSFAVSDGNGGKNYEVTVPTTTFSVSKLELTHNIAVASAKEYDGTDTAKYTGDGLTNALSGDNVSLVDFTLNYATVNADTGIAVTPSQWKLTGADTGSYTLPAFGEQKATITARLITLSIQQDDVNYGDSLSPAVALASGSSLVSCDTSFVGALAVTGDTSTSGRLAAGQHGFALGTFAVSDGNGGKNYEIAIPSGATFTVSPLMLMYSIAVDSAKEYDGTTTAGYTGDSLTGVLSGDNVSLDDFTLNYATPSAGDSIAVTPSQWKLTGADTGCYALPDFGKKTADIIPAPLRITPDTLQSKIYKDPDPALTYTASGWKTESDSLNQRSILTGELSRDAGAQAGDYEITLGTLKANGSYSIIFVEGVKFRIIRELMSSLSIAYGDGDILAHWGSDSIADTIRYEVPCDKNDAAKQLTLHYDALSGVTGRFVEEENIVGKGGETVEDAVSGDLIVDMGNAGRKSLTIELHDASTDLSKRYTIMLEKKFELFYIIREHLGHLRVVHNNPLLNGHGMEFSVCDWYQWSWDRSEWELVAFGPLYYTAGASVRDNKFTDRDSMYVKLITTDNILLETCPDVSKNADKDTVAGGGDTGDTRSVDLSVYPNPVATGGTIKLKQAELADGEDAPYTAFYLFDAQGRLTLTGSFSALRGGLTMPEAPGIYHLVLEGKAGRKVVKVAVGQQK
ncbi:MAG: YDG domain-containing protein, partial [Prevotellaceae bacterium]|nr:YDG domain-containing protein [Prevotellaceae bacterium]